MDLEKRIEAIEVRNKGVESDKAWEVSWTRRLLLCGFTYIVVTCFIWAIGVPNPLLSGLVPAAGFLISTLTMPLFKSYWLRSRKDKHTQD